MRKKYIEVGTKVKISKLGSTNGIQCPKCFNWYKRVDKHIKKAHGIISKKVRRRLLSKTHRKTDMEQTDLKFYVAFQKNYLNHRISGKSTIKDISGNRDIKNAKAVIGYLRKEFGEEKTIPILVCEMKSIKKLGEGGNGYIDRKVSWSNKELLVDFVQIVVK